MQVEFTDGVNKLVSGLGADGSAQLLVSQRSAIESYGWLVINGVTSDHKITGVSEEAVLAEAERILREADRRSLELPS